MKPKAVAGVIMSTRKPDGGKEEKGMEGEDHALEACSEDMIRAFHAKDVKALAKAFRAAFECLEMEPHDEVEHDSEAPSPHSYDAQNIEAGKR